MGDHKSRTKSKCTDEFPYTGTTEDVEDGLDAMQTLMGTNLSASPPEYRLVSICNKEARSSLTLTPAHGKHVFALAVVTSIQDNTLCAETVETIQKDEKNSLTMTMRQEMALAVDLIKHASTGVATPWTDTTSPLCAPPCRALSKSPTGPELEPIEPTTTNSPVSCKSDYRFQGT